MDFKPEIIHHGAVNGVTGSCHQLTINSASGILIDCGLFQGAEVSGNSAADHLAIEFDVSTITALIVTHCHIDHVGRIPYLLAAGFTGPIFCTEASASLLPLVIEDALKVGVTRDKDLIAACIKLLKRQIKPIAYKQWFTIPVHSTISSTDHSPDSAKLNSHHTYYQQAKAKFQPAGHILGSAYVEVELAKPSNMQVNASSDKKSSSKYRSKHRVVFSGDLGAPYAPLLPSPKSPYRADTLVIESTYGDKNHHSRKLRRQQLQRVIEKAVADNGVVLIPAFSIGRTQELLYELEQIIYSQQKILKQRASQNKLTGNNSQVDTESTEQSFWQSIEVIVDSPMAANFTEQYKQFKNLWDAEAKQKVAKGRHPLNFSQLYTIDGHKQHLSAVKVLAKRNKPAIVIAASGMCAGGRILNYLKQLIGDKTTDVLFVGYQAQGTPGRDIQRFSKKENGYVVLDNQRYAINAAVHTLSGYSAHADQAGLVNFVKRMRYKPAHIKIVHGDQEAKEALQACYQYLLPQTFVEIAE